MHWWKSWFSRTLDTLQGGRRSKHAAPRARVQMEELESRFVPSTIDLASAGAAGGANGAIFTQANPQPTGTGVIRSFVRVQSPGSATLEQGYNTSARPLQFDENSSPVFTHSLRLRDIPEVTVNGAKYREFLLDVNQSASTPLVSLDELRLFVGAAAGVNAYNADSHQLAGATQVYDLGNNWIKLDASLTHGSGSGDMFALIPSSSFGADTSQYVTLYSKFGVNNAANGGFEEWAVSAKPVSVPLPSGTAGLSGAVIDAVSGAGIGGVTITLTDSNGLSYTKLTNPDGSFSFGDLPPGTYTLTETLPPDFLPVSDTAGTDNGQPDGTANPNDTEIDHITLGGGDTATGFLFKAISPGT